ncbi:hypothetical protein [Acinetobacter sp. MD2]|uniref:hypothetical protein n=1 Tax=Acinetobacter sp. MD2 TaxID=2600066 RepID=UPI002D1E7602|nr:hypothetical protein [Acinetobacter sp. MD2]MEB3766461.1 hypothetical protein [Acinetobacter sp. MD2]
MLQKHTNFIKVLSFGIVLALAGCQRSNEPEHKVEIKPAPKLSNDATAYAKQAWQLINQVESVVNLNQPQQINEQLRKPLRELGISWKINVKMGDAVTEGKYAFCRRALTSLDMWAKAVQDQDSNTAQSKQQYLQDKNLCKYALDHPELGNTSPN